jgi:hypothetical protein
LVACTPYLVTEVNGGAVYEAAPVSFEIEHEDDEVRQRPRSSGKPECREKWTVDSQEQHFTAQLCRESVVENSFAASGMWCGGCYSIVEL